MEADVTEPRAPGTLFVVSTPIGNMGDFSFRAVETLRSGDRRPRRGHAAHAASAASATRSRRRSSSYHEHNEAKTTPRLVARLRRRREPRARLRRRHAAALRSWRATRARGDRRGRARVARSRRVGAALGARRLGPRRRAVHLLRLPRREGAASGARRSTRSSRCGTPPCCTRRPSRVAATLAELADAGAGEPGQRSWPAK